MVATAHVGQRTADVMDRDAMTQYDTMRFHIYAQGQGCMRMYQDILKSWFDQKTQQCRHTGIDI